jgi:hypothetical protein
MCHGTGYLTAQGSEQEVAFMRAQYGEASVEQGLGQGAGSEREHSLVGPFDPQLA